MLPKPFDYEEHQREALFVSDDIANLGHGFVCTMAGNDWECSRYGSAGKVWYSILTEWYILLHHEFRSADSWYQWLILQL